MHNLVHRYQSCIHNLTNINIPKAVEICLFLGYKFNFDMKPNFDKIEKCIKEGVRKYAWRVFFMNRGEVNKVDELTKVIIKIKKSIDNGKDKLICPLENVLFGKNFSSHCTSMLKISNNNKYVTSLFNRASY